MTVMGDPASHFITVPDGLRLHVRIYGSLLASALPVVCLAGLTRNSTDFDVLARALSADAKRPRAVIALDARGRGRSDYDTNARNYNLAVELADVLAVLTALEVPPAVFIGTSRGGILAMLLGVARPGAIASVVLNDIGPVIEIKGLLRIKSYVGRLPQPQSFEDGAEFLRRLFGIQFPKLSPDDWMAFARRSFEEPAPSPAGGGSKGTGLVATHDPNLAKTLEGVDAQQPPPALWNEFDALRRRPIMVIRGANSDVLSAEGVAAMAARRPDLEILEVPDQGHAPLLVEEEVIARICAFVARCEEKPPAREPGVGSPTTR
jgi:pimeloyl-ACP methyl ester carboxylesterase